MRLLAWLLVSAFLPTAAATFETAVEAVGPIVKPETGQLGIKATFTIDCETVRTDAPPVAAGPLEVSVSWDAPSLPAGSYSVTGPAMVLLDTGACTSPLASEATTGAHYLFSATRDAPGLQFLPLSMVAEARSSMATFTPQHATAETHVAVDYWPLIQARAPDQVLQGRPRSILPFVVEVQNFGNAQTIVSFAQADAPSEGQQWRVAVAHPLVLDSPAKIGGGGLTSDGAVIEVHTPYKDGWNNGEQAFTVMAMPAAALDQDKQGLPVQITLLARVRGCYVGGIDAMDAALAECRKVCDLERQHGMESPECIDVGRLEASRDAPAPFALLLPALAAAVRLSRRLRGSA